jgi:hypothetical protein
MIFYSVKNHILELTVSAPYLMADLDAMLEAIGRDPGVPEGALLLVDARVFAVLLSESEIEARLDNLRTRLGRKLGPACAIVIETHEQRLGARVFQMKAATEDLRVGVFEDLAEARAWLAPFVDARNSSR